MAGGRGKILRAGDNILECEENKSWFRQKLVSVESVKCDVEYDRNCTMARKQVK